MKNQRGAVTAEAAVVLPVLTAFAVALVFLINLGIVQVRSMDAAREAARSVARGDSIAKARSVAQRVAVAGAAVRIMKGAKTVKVQVSTPVSRPGGLLRGHLGMLTAKAEALMEPAVEAGAQP